MAGRYAVTLKTGTRKGAGTDSNVFITLHDRNGRSTYEHNLDKRGDNFEKGYLETFHIWDKYIIDDLKSFTLRKDNRNKYADWYVEHIKIRDHKNKKEYSAKLSRWFTRDEDVITLPAEKTEVNRYSVTVKTGTISGAGTDSRIYITFQDKEGKATPEYYINDRRDNFEKGYRETFYLNDESNLDELQQIVVRKDNKGDHAPWFVETIEVQDNHLNKTYDLVINQWFNAAHPMRIIEVAPNLTSYNISIKTGYETKAGTNADIKVNLIGSRGSSGWLKLDSRRDDFEKGDLDRFTINTPDNLGTLRRIAIGHPNNGNNPGWYCSFISIEEKGSGAAWSTPVYRWFSKSDDDRRTWRTLSLRPGTISDVGEVYWCARDLDSDGLFDAIATSVGNHHFILIRYRNREECLRITEKYNLEYKTEKKGRVTHYFTTIGGFAENEDTLWENVTDSTENHWGPIKPKINQSADVKSVREWLDPDQHVSMWSWDYDIERHYMAPTASLGTDEKVIEAVIKATQKFMENYPNVPNYDLDDRNCATWANSLFRAIGYPSSYRREKADFNGLDVANHNCINSKYFR